VKENSSSKSDCQIQSRSLSYKENSSVNLRYAEI